MVEQCPLDALLDALGNGRRREALRILADRGGASNIREIGDALDAGYQQAYISLYQAHFPKLEDYGLIEWDRRTHDVSLTAEGEAAIEMLELIERGIGSPRFRSAVLRVSTRIFPEVEYERC